MSDTEKPIPTPEIASSGHPEAESDPNRVRAANVISIAEGAEMLRKSRAKTAPTPARGVVDLSRARGREVPSPVTMPPGEHSAVIVTDTPAARAHFDRRTVHPGDAPERVHDKKVRVKTHLDPRRAKTQITEKRVSDPGPQPARVPVSAAAITASSRDTPPPRLVGEARLSASYSRGSKTSVPPEASKKGSIMFLAGVTVAAALAAVVVYTLSRGGTSPSGSGSDAPVASASETALSPGPVVPVPRSAAPLPSEDATAMAPALTAAPPTTETRIAPAIPSDVPSVNVPATVTSPPVVKTVTAPSTKPSASATASVKPTATSILPFGKEER